MTPEGQLDGKIVIVTGGGAGIGLGIVKSCLAAGATVVCATVDAAEGAHTEALGAFFLQTDVADPHSLQRMIDRTTDLYGRIDGLVNNAGITIVKPFLDFPAGDLERLWQVNLRGAFLAGQMAARVMVGQESGGSIVNIASNHSRATGAGYEMYAATKGALTAMSRGMAWSLGQHGVRVNTLSPGLTLTDAVQAGPAADPDTDALFRSWHATGRYNEVGEVGAAAVFLLSDASSAMTGSEIVADQGMSARLGAI